MPIDFKLTDFCYPVSILKLRNFLEKSQWFSLQELEAYQFKKLKIMLNHVYENVPYYQKLFAAGGITPKDITSLGDLKKIPVLDKNIFNVSRDLFFAKNAGKFKPIGYNTTGTSSAPVMFYRDRFARTLEIAYYLRHWSWGGYKIGSPIGEISCWFFLKKKKNTNKPFYYDPVVRRLIINGNLLSEQNLDLIINEIKKRRIVFFRGPATAIYAFSLLLRNKPHHSISLKAVFPVGEMLLDYQRKLIEKSFSCQVFDSYGNMEGTGAISQCEKGGYHINSDYGIIEIKDLRLPGLGPCSSGYTGLAIGTNLYNFAMPLLRYSHDDIISASPNAGTCPCKRGLPLIKSVQGRLSDVIVTPDGRYISSLSEVFNFVNGITLGQIIQEEASRLVVKISKSADFGQDNEKKLLEMISNIVGRSVNVRVEYIPFAELTTYPRSKFRPVISYVKKEYGMSIKD